MPLLRKRNDGGKNSSKLYLKVIMDQLSNVIYNYEHNEHMNKERLLNTLKSIVDEYNLDKNGEADYKNKKKDI